MPFTPGSPNDVVGRLLAQQMTTRLGQNVIIDNRPGAGTNAGTKAAASAEPNGYTLLFNSSSMVVSPAMYRNPGYDPEKNFVPVANTIFGHWVTVIEKSIPANTVPEFIAYAKKNPGKLAFGYGQGTAPQLVGEWLKVREGVDITSVPYKGGPQAVIDLIGGRIHFHITTTATGMPHIKDGNVKAISVWSPKRYPLLPNVPTMIESGYPESRARLLGRSMGAGRHARRDREAAQRGHQREPGIRRDEGQPRQARPRAGDPDAGGIRQVRARRGPALGRDREGERGEGRLTSCCLGRAASDRPPRTNTPEETMTTRRTSWPPPRPPCCVRPQTSRPRNPFPTARSGSSSRSRPAAPPT